MSEYNIPDDADELFANGEAHYEIRDYDRECDNIGAMILFLECVGVPEEFVVEDDGTQVTLSNGTVTLCIDSGGLGDFFSHGFDVTVLPGSHRVARF